MRGGAIQLPACGRRSLAHVVAPDVSPYLGLFGCELPFRESLSEGSVLFNEYFLCSIRGLRESTGQSLLAFLDFGEQRDVLDRFGRRERLQIGVDVPQFLIGRHLIGIGRHFARRPADVPNQIRRLEQHRHDARSGSAALAGVTMALIAADFDEQDLAGCGVSLGSGVALLSTCKHTGHERK